MKTSVLLNSYSEAVRIYVSLLVFSNEYSDIADPQYRHHIDRAKYIVLTMDLSTEDSDCAYIFTMGEIETCIEALRYAAGRGFIFAPRDIADRLIAKLVSKRDTMIEAQKLLEPWSIPLAKTTHQGLR